MNSITFVLIPQHEIRYVQLGPNPPVPNPPDPSLIKHITFNFYCNTTGSDGNFPNPSSIEVNGHQLSMGEGNDGTLTKDQNNNTITSIIDDINENQNYFYISYIKGSAPNIENSNVNESLSITINGTAVQTISENGTYGINLNDYYDNSNDITIGVFRTSTLTITTGGGGGGGGGGTTPIEPDPEPDPDPIGENMWKLTSGTKSYSNEVLKFVSCTVNESIEGNDGAGESWDEDYSTSFTVRYYYSSEYGSIIYDDNGGGDDVASPFDPGLSFTPSYSRNGIIMRTYDRRTDHYVSGLNTLSWYEYYMPKSSLPADGSEGHAWGVYGATANATFSIEESGSTSSSYSNNAWSSWQSSGNPIGPDDISIQVDETTGRITASFQYGGTTYTKSQSPTNGATNTLSWQEKIDTHDDSISSFGIVVNVNITATNINYVENEEEN